MKKSILILICTIFLIHGLWLFKISEFGDKQNANPNDKGSSKRVDSFEKVEFFIKGEQKSNVLIIASSFEWVSIDEIGVGHFTNGLGNGVDQNGEKFSFEAQIGDYYPERQEIKLREDVVLNYKEFRLESKFGNYNLGTEVFKGRGDVKSFSFNKETSDEIEVYSDEVKAFVRKNSAQYLGNVRGVITKKKKYLGTVEMSAQSLDLDLNTNKAYLERDVLVKREGMQVKANKSEILLENFNKKLKYYEFTGDVVVKQKVSPPGAEPFERTSYSEKLVGHVLEKKVILTGAPRVMSKDDIIRGSKIILRDNASIVEVIDSASRLKYK